MSTNFELFPGKNLSGLFEDIYENQKNKKQRISELIAEMKKVIRHSGDMAVIGPIIKDLVDTSVRNDESLIKMAAIAQRMIASKDKSEGDTGFLTDKEKEQLLQQLEDTVYEVENEKTKVDDLTNEVEELKQKGNPLVFVEDVVGTGSSRKSATNSVLWHMGDEIPYIPNKKEGGFCFGGKIAPIFFNTLEDSGAFPIEMDVSDLDMGQEIILKPFAGEVVDANTNEVITKFDLKTDVLLDEVRANGRIPLIIGRQLTDKTRAALNLEPSDLFRRPGSKDESSKGFTLAQKMVGKACGVKGIRPNTYCEPVMTTVGSQDTTGPMTRDELKELACLGFSADLVMQSFCHTAAYPKPVDIDTQHSLPDFIMNRGGVSLRPGDGIIHSWLNRMLMPDTVGTGGDSHTRFPIGISFPAGSGLVAFAATLGVMPLDMPESVLVRFKGEMQPGITLRDLVNAIPYAAIQKGLLTVAKEGKKNIFSGRCLEIEGLPDLKVEQAFELSDASAERSASGCTVRLNKEPIIEYLESNIVMLRWMIANGYGDPKTLERRAQAWKNGLRTQNFSNQTLMLNMQKLLKLI